MFCRQCGTKLDDDALFCHECGYKIKKKNTSEANQAANQMPSQMPNQIPNQMVNQAVNQMPSQMPNQMPNQMVNQATNQAVNQMPSQIPNQPFNGGNAMQIPPYVGGPTYAYSQAGQGANITKKKGKLPIIITIITVLVLIAGGVIAFILFSDPGSGSTSSASEYKEKLELAEKYFAEMDYERAIALYEEAIDISPKRADAYVGLADVYVAMGEEDMAIEVLDSTKAVMDEENQNMILDKKQEIIDEYYDGEWQGKSADEMFMTSDDNDDEKSDAKERDSEEESEEGELFDEYVDTVIEEDFGMISEDEELIGTYESTEYGLYQNLEPVTGFIGHKNVDLDNDGVDELVAVLLEDNSICVHIYEINDAAFSEEDFDEDDYGGNSVYSEQLYGGKIVMQTYIRPMETYIGDADETEISISIAKRNGKAYIVVSSFKMVYMIGDGVSSQICVLSYDGKSMFYEEQFSQVGSEFSGDEDYVEQHVNILESLGFTKGCIVDDGLLLFDHEAEKLNLIVKIQGKHEDYADEYYTYEEMMNNPKYAGIVRYRFFIGN